ncbi:phosphatidylethanolamine-binding protein [Cladorrhinum sp. PSN259]|nr:phosphatidylethanolamine-binding protein [Cladorrhinum sp. PSN259]
MFVPKSILFLPLLLVNAQAAPSTRLQQHIMSSTTTSDGPAKQVRDELKKSEVIPTVVDDFIPSLLLSVSWPNTNQEASLGNTLKPDDLQDAPSVSVKPIAPLNSSGEGETNLVIVTTDPDAPSRDDPKWSEFCHWIGVTSSSSEGKALKLDDVMPYKPPGPPEKTGKHRYVFLALVPANGTTEELSLSKPSERKHWGYGDDGVKGVREWAGENGLVVVAANFIYAQNKKQ